VPRERTTAMMIFPMGGSAVELDQIAEVRPAGHGPRPCDGAYMRPYMRAANVTWDGISLDDVKEMDFTPKSTRSTPFARVTSSWGRRRAARTR